MKIKIKNNIKNKQKEEYIIPLGIIMYLNEMYEKEVSFEIIRYFLHYLKENKISYLSSYLNDYNEIKISLNNLSNKDIKFDKKINDILIEKFMSFLKEKDDNLYIFEEVLDDLYEINSYKEYELIFENKKKEIEEEKNKFELDVIEESKQEEEEQKIDLIFLDEEITEIVEKIINEKKINFNKNIEHEWKDTSIRFKNGDGSWGKWVDLQGPSGSGKGGHGGGGTSKRKIQYMIDKSIEEIVFPSSTTRAFSFFL